MNIQRQEPGVNERSLGAILALLSVSVGVVSGLVLTPVILRHLDRAEFGLYQLIGAFVGYLALFDFGITGTLARFTAKYLAENDRIRQHNAFSMCLIIYSVLGVILLGLGWILYCNLDVIFRRSLSQDELSQARVMFLILLGSVLAAILGRAFVGVSAGHERFVFSNTVQVCSTAAKAAVIVAVLVLGGKAIGIVVVEAACNLVILLLNTAYAFGVLKVRFKLHHWDWRLLGELASFACWVFVTTLVLQVNFRIGHFVLGVMTSTGNRSHPGKQ
jgi:O-antigen/teichoic acid export membrane protein